jgi:hypothetical protein
VLHVNVQEPVEHPAVALATLVVHAVGLLQAPLAVHDSTLLPLHCVCPGAHDPVQPPVTQVWLLHATAVLHDPSLPQVWTPLPEHWVVAGTQVPVHPPLTHAELTHAEAAPHVPSD